MDLYFRLGCAHRLLAFLPISIPPGGQTNLNGQADSGTKTRKDSYVTLWKNSNFSHLGRRVGTKGTTQHVIHKEGYRNF